MDVYIHKLKFNNTKIRINMQMNSNVILTER